MKRPSAEMLIVFALAARAPAIKPGPPPPWTSRLRITSAAPNPAPASGWRDGKLTRSPPPLTGACSSSASCTNCAMPFGVRAMRPATRRGFSAARSSRAVSRTAAASPAGGADIVSRGIFGAPSPSARSCIS